MCGPTRLGRIEWDENPIETSLCKPCLVVSTTSHYANLVCCSGQCDVVRMRRVKKHIQTYHADLEHRARHVIVTCNGKFYERKKIRKKHFLWQKLLVFISTFRLWRTGINTLRVHWSHGLRLNLTQPIINYCYCFNFFLLWVSIIKEIKFERSAASTLGLTSGAS